MAGNASKVLKVKHTTPGHLRFAIRGEEELDSFIKTTIAGFSEIPYTSKSLIRKKEKKERAKKKNCLGNVLDSLLFFTVCNLDEGHQWGCMGSLRTVQWKSTDNFCRQDKRNIGMFLDSRSLVSPFPYGNSCVWIG